MIGSNYGAVFYCRISRSDMSIISLTIRMCHFITMVFDFFIADFDLPLLVGDSFQFCSIQLFNNNQVIQIETSHGSCPIRLDQITKFMGPSGCVNSSRFGSLIF